jgi:hypothetical protein
MRHEWTKSNFGIPQVLLITLTRETMLIRRFPAFKLNIRRCDEAARLFATEGQERRRGGA